MKPDKFIDAMGHIDESIIDEFQKAGKVRGVASWVKITSVAASIAVVLSATLLIWRHGGGIEPAMPPVTGTVTEAPVTDQPDDPPHVTHEDFKIVSVDAEKKEGSFISADTEFVVKTEHGTAEDVRTHLFISTAPEYSVRQIAEETFQVQLAGAIADNTVVSLSYVEDGIIDHSWAFQTEGKLSLSGSYPRDGVATASVDTVIELEFSYSSAKGVEDAVTFEPSIEGTWEHAGRIWRFTPDEPLEKDTTYKIYVGKGITAEGREIEKTAAVTFSTYEERAPYDCRPGIVTVDGINSYRPGDSITVRYSDHSEEDASIGHVELEQFEEYSDMIAFADGESVYDSVHIKNAEFDTEIIAANEYGVSVVNLRLADTLEQGYYLARVYAEDGSHLFDWIIQVHPMSVYAMISERDVLVWTALDGEAAAGVPVSFTDIEAETGEDGTLLMKDATDGYGEICYLLAGDEDAPFVLGTPSFSHENYPSSYIYSDKPQYRSTDTVKVWGMIPLDLFYEEPDGVFEVMIGSEKESAVAVTPDENGTFECEIRLVNHAETYPGDLNLVYDGVIIGTRDIYISEFSHNNYTLTYSLERQYLEAGETLEFEATMTHVSGLVVTGKTISAKLDGRIFTAVTDENGTAHFSVSPDDYTSFKDYDDPAHTEYTGEIDIYMGDPETSRKPDAEFYVKIMKTPVGARIAINYDHDLDIELYYHSPDSENGVDGAEGKEYTGFDGAVFTDGAPYETNVTVRVDVHRITREVIRYEDSNITGEQIPIYEPESQYSDEIIDTFVISGMTEDGVFTAEPSDYELPESTETEKYRLEYSVEAELPRGFVLRAENRQLDFNNFVNPYSNYPGASEYAYTNKLPGVSSEYYNYGYYLTYEKTGNADSAAISKYTVKAYDESDIEGGKVMYFLYSQGIGETHIIDSSEFEIDGSKVDMAHYQVGAVYFKDGVFHRVRSYMGGYGSTIQPRRESELDIDITADKDTHAPGDTAKITVAVTDKDGNTLPGASVNISVVEDSAFGGYDSTRIGEVIYGGSSVNEYFYSSYTDYSLAFDGMGGCGSGVVPNQHTPEFGDTVYFGTAITDEDGKCTAEFVLPEGSVTEYRVTVHAVNSELSSGVNTANIAAESDFFIQPGEVKYTKITDDLVIPATLLTAVPDTAVMNFRLNELDLELNVSAETGKMSYANFGKIPAGDYTVIITAVSDTGDPELVHEITVPVSVHVNTLEVTESHTVDVTEELEFAPSSSPVTMKFFNEETERYGKYISFIRETESERFDTVIANTYASTVREKIYGIPGSNSLSSLSKYTISGTEYSNLAMLEDGDPDAPLTALYMYITGDRNTVSGHYGSGTRYTLSPEIEVAESLLIRAAAGEAVLVDLLYAAQEVSDDPYARALLSLALSISGDTASAKDILIPVGEDATEGDRALYCAALVFVDRAAAGEEIDRLMAESPDEPYLGLAASIYMKTGEAQMGNADSVTVICGDQKIDVTIQGLSEETLVLSVEDGAVIRFENATEGMRTSYSYQATFTPKEDENNVRGLEVSISSNLSVSDAGVIRIGLGDISNGGKAKIALPSGLRYDSPYYGISSNIITSSAHDGEQFIEIPVTAIAPGHYILEPVIYTVNGVNYYSDTVEFTVGSGGSHTADDPAEVTEEPAVTETEATESMETEETEEAEETVETAVTE